jgi:hypothetical protein
MVHLGRPGATGEASRVAGLTEIFEAAGATVVDVSLRRDHGIRATDLREPGLGAVLEGRAVPESLAWNHRSLRRRLVDIGADVVVCGTARAFHPTLVDGPWDIVLDFVDRLSDSYRDRAAIVGWSPWAPAFRFLAGTAGRFERRPLPAGVTGIAAGWSDANALGVTWVPITVPSPPFAAGVEPTHDALFLGKLSYPPNVEAIHRIARIWPDVLRRRPGTTLVLAGAQPARSTIELADRLGWTVAADFPDLDAIVAQVRVAVVPLLHASGIQIKVLATAAYGLPQVLGPAARAGLAPGFPARMADRDDEFVAALVDLLDDEPERSRLGREAREHVATLYSVDRWTGWAGEVLQRAGSHRAP